MSAYINSFSYFYFKVCNYVKQCLLKPYHDWAMRVLRRLPNDGTYNQTAPLKYVLDGGDVTSYDLSSATDRFPSVVLFHVMAELFGEEVASATVVASLSTSWFTIGPPLTRKKYTARFAVGQPLGYYLSWSLFSLTHHIIVWWAALRADPNRRGPYRNYAILGDNVVIADSTVAREYALILRGLQVLVSEKKSILSARGGLEFAKKFMCWGARVDLSPVSIPSLTALNTCSGLRAFQVKNYPALSMGVLFRLAGAGYKVLGRLASSQRKGFSSLLWERLRLLVLAPVRPSAADFEWWLGGNMPINPYQRGQLWWWLADETRPREPQIECILGNEEDQVCDPEQEFLERTCLHGWMRVWLKALLSHVRIVSDMSNSLLSMLELPLVQSYPFRANIDPEIQPIQVH